MSFSVAFAKTESIEVFYNNLKLKINGEIVESDQEPFILNGRTFVPLRTVAESLGKQVLYNESTSEILIDDVDMNVAKQSVQQESINNTGGNQVTKPKPVSKKTEDNIRCILKDDIYWLSISDILNEYSQLKVTQSESDVDICSILDKDNNVLVENIKVTNLFGSAYITEEYYINTVYQKIKDKK
jgi:hypothetical protein